MTDFQTAKDALEKLFSAKADEQILSRALTGDGITTSTDVTNRPGYTWVRYNLSPNKVSQVVNTRYPSIAADLPVVIGKMYKDDKFEQILGVDFSQYLDTLTNTIVNNLVVGAHGASHNAVTGSDPAIIDLRNIVEGKGRETVPASLSIYVEAFRYFDSGVLVTFGGGQIDISADAPAAGNHLFDLIYVDVATNALDSFPGAEVPLPMPPGVPAVPSGAIPICLVDYVNGATSFTEANIYDYRVWLSHPPTHTLLSATHTDTVASAVTRGDLIVGNATPAWDDLAIGTAHQLLKVNAGGTDPTYASFDWDDIGAAAGADMVHTHASAGEGGQLDWDNIWSDAVHDHSSAGEGGTALSPATLYATDATDASSLITGALQSAGGLGVTKSIWVGINIVLQATTTGQGLRWDSGGTQVANFQALDTGGTSFIFFATNRYYDGAAWQLMNNRVAGDLQISGDALQYNTFAAASTTTARRFTIATTTFYIGLGTTSAPSTQAHINETKVLGASPADGYSAALTFAPTYDQAYTVTRHNYMDVRNTLLTNSAVVTDAAVMRFDANVGTHKALASNAAVATTITSVGPTGAQTTIQGWLKINVNGTLRYIPFW